MLPLQQCKQATKNVKKKKNRVYDIKFWRWHIHVFRVSISWKVQLCTFKFEMHEDHRLKGADALFESKRHQIIYTEYISKII